MTKCLLNSECPLGSCDSNNQCRTKLEAGDFCSPGASCPAPYQCIRGRCTKNPPNSPCRFNGDCQESEYCSRAQSKCVPRVEAGQACRFTQTCKEGLVCSQGICYERCLTPAGFCPLTQTCSNRNTCIEKSAATPPTPKGPADNDVPFAKFPWLTKTYLIWGGVGLGAMALLVVLGIVIYCVVKRRGSAPVKGVETAPSEPPTAATATAPVAAAYPTSYPDNNMGASSSGYAADMGAGASSGYADMGAGASSGYAAAPPPAYTPPSEASSQTYRSEKQ